MYVCVSSVGACVDEVTVHLTAKKNREKMLKKL